jgi:hypothetical protein
MIASMTKLCYRFLLPLSIMAVLVYGPRPAAAQLNKAEKSRIAASIATDINREIRQRSQTDAMLREKVVSRLFECGYVFLVISKQADSPENGAQIHDVGEISFELSALVSEDMPTERFKQIGDAATRSIKEKFAAARTPASEFEMNVLAKNCKSFHKIDAVAGAVAALLPPVPQESNSSAIELAKELQECSLYYALLAGDLLTQVPQRSGPLSSSDRVKVVKSQVYMTKSEQIEVLYKRVALLAGAATLLKERRDVMFEKEKRVMTQRWITGRLDERYKDICDYILSDAGSKARLKEIGDGNVCGRLYTCW